MSSVESTTPRRHNNRRRRRRRNQNNNLFSNNIRRRLVRIKTSLFCQNQYRICQSFPILVLIAIASLDNADKQLLSSSFPILEKIIGWNVSTLGNFSIATNLSYALSLPMWGYLIHKCSTINNVTNATTNKSTNQSIHRSKNTKMMIRHNLQQLLGLACTIWGIATIGIAIVTNIQAEAKTQAQAQDSSSSSAWYYNILQIITRCINGIALGSILPLSQSLLVEYTPNKNLRGQTFGLMSVGEKLAGTIASTSIIYVGYKYWFYVYYAIGMLSILMGGIARYYMSNNSTSTSNSEVKKCDDIMIQDDGDKNNDNERESLVNNNNNNNNNSIDYDSNNEGEGEEEDDVVVILSLKQIIQRIIRLPAFMCLVAQGVFGGTPWDMMSFLLLLMDWRGYTNDQIALIQITSGISSMIGGWCGGIMGDHAAEHGLLGSQKGTSQGRIVLALLSVLLGIPLYGLFLYETNFIYAITYINLFQLVATWAPPAAIRPICADLTNGPSERAQIVALWIVLEKLSGSLFGAPLVGYLTDRMLTNNSNNDQKSTNEKSEALAFNIFLLSTIFWCMCAFFWFIMLLAIQRTPIQRLHTNNIDSQRKRTVPV